MKCVKMRDLNKEIFLTISFYSDDDDRNFNNKKINNASNILFYLQIRCQVQHCLDASFDVRLRQLISVDKFKNSVVQTT